MGYARSMTSRYFEEYWSSLSYAVQSLDCGVGFLRQHCAVSFVTRAEISLSFWGSSIFDLLNFSFAFQTCSCIDDELIGKRCLLLYKKHSDMRLPAFMMSSFLQVCLLDAVMTSQAISIERWPGTFKVNGMPVLSSALHRAIEMSILIRSSMIEVWCTQMSFDRVSSNDSTRVNRESWQDYFIACDLTERMTSLVFSIRSDRYQNE